MISATFNKYILNLFQKKNAKSVYKCQLCPTISNSTKRIQQHIAVVHEGKKEYTCEICQKQFGFFKNKKAHQESGKCRGKPKKADVGYVKITVIHPHFSNLQKMLIGQM